MNRRLALGLVALGLVVVTAGCSSILGPGEPNAEKLGENASYDWKTPANGTIDINGSRYVATYRIDNRSSIDLYQRDALGTEHPLDVEGLQFRYPNGTVVSYNETRAFNDSNVEQTRDRLVVSPPTRNGTLAFTKSRRGKQFATPTFVEGSYQVTLPDRASVGVPVLAQVRPRGYTTVTDSDGRVTITWDDVEARSISVRYYLDRDLWLFGGLIGLALLLGGGGLFYYIRQIRTLERRREEVGLDVDEGDDVGDRGPPPGMG